MCIGNSIPPDGCPVGLPIAIPTGHPPGGTAVSWCEATVSWRRAPGRIAPAGRMAAPALADAVLAGAEPEQEPVRSNRGGTRQEQQHPVGRRADHFLSRGAVDAGDAAEYLSLGYPGTDADGRLPPAFVGAAQPEEPAEVVRCRRAAG